MPLLEIGVFAVAAVLTATPWRRWSWRAEHLVLLLLVFQAIGYARLGSTVEGWRTSTIVALFAMTMALGASAADFALLASARGLPFGRGRHPLAAANDFSASPRQRRESASRLAVPITLTVVLSLYHYAVVGLPILSGVTETARWSVSDSGLLGLPGRAVVIAVPLSMAVIVALRAQGTTWPSSQSARILLFAGLTAILLLSGFRGLLATTVVIVVAAYLLRADGIRPGIAPMLRGLVLVIVALSAVAAMSGLYESYRGVNNPARLVWDRLTVGGVEAGDVLLSAKGSGIVADGRSALGNDFEYYAGQYGVLAEQGGRYETSEYVSSRMTGRRLGGDLFIVPVTTTAIAVLIFDFGVLGSLLSAMIIGGSLRLLGCKILRSGIYTLPITLGLYSALLMFVVRGNLPYNVINWAAIGVAMWASVTASRISLGGRRKSRPGLSLS